jgi:ABC-type phosphate transport system substrate-binding protein
MGNNFRTKEKMVKTGAVLKIIMLATLTLGLLAAVGCVNVTKISEVKADSSKYAGKTITIKGTVG